MKIQRDEKMQSILVLNKGFVKFNDLYEQT